MIILCQFTPYFAPLALPCSLRVHPPPYIFLACFRQIREKSKTFNLYVIILVLSIILAILVFSGL